MKNFLSLSNLCISLLSKLKWLYRITSLHQNKLYIVYKLYWNGKNFEENTNHPNSDFCNKI